MVRWVNPARAAVNPLPCDGAAPLPETVLPPDAPACCQAPPADPPLPAAGEVTLLGQPNSTLPAVPPTAVVPMLVAWPLAVLPGAQRVEGVPPAPTV